MEDDQHFTLYNKPERKRELVVQLEAMLVEYRKASDTLDSKAWEILKVASATFGVVSALEITLSTGTLQLQFWLALLFALLVYSWLIFEVLSVCYFSSRVALSTGYRTRSIELRRFSD